MVEVIEAVLNSQYLFAILFVGILFGGEIFLIPAVYFAFLGSIDISLLFVVAIVATAIGDSFWYGVGRLLPNNRLAKLRIVRRNHVAINKLSRFFSTYGLWLLFYSKFVYGTRLATQIIFGLNRRNYWAYLAVNTFGVLAWIGFIFAMAFVVNYSLDTLKTAVFGTQIVFLVFVLAVVAINVWMKRIAKRTILKNGEAEDEQSSQDHPDQTRT